MDEQQKMTDLDWEMSRQCWEELRSDPSADGRVIIADWLRKARLAALTKGKGAP